MIPFVHFCYWIESNTTTLLLNQQKEEKEKKNQSDNKQAGSNKEKDQAQQQSGSTQQQGQSGQFVNSNNNNKDQGQSQQLYGNQTNSGSSFTNFDSDANQAHRQRTDSFSIPNQSSQIIQNQLKLKTTVKLQDLLPQNQQQQQLQKDNNLQSPNPNNLGNNKSRKNSENIPQTPMFLPQKTQRTMYLNIPGQNNQNGKNKQSNQDFTLNNQSQNHHHPMVISYDLEQQSNDMNLEDIQQPPQFKNSMSIKDLMKAETPEKKKILQQQKMLFQDNNNNNVQLQQNNTRNFIQSPDSNFFTRQIRQNSLQEDKRIKLPASKQSQILRDKELINAKNDEQIRDSHWIQSSSKPSKKFQEKRQQNLNMQQRDLINPSFDRMEQMEQKQFSRKRHQLIDNFAHASDSDDMEDEGDKGYSVNKILEVQKKRKQERLLKFTKQKEQEKKNQLAFNTPYSNNMNTLVTINHREQEKLEIEENASKPVSKQNEVAQKKPEIQVNLSENKGLFDIKSFGNEANNEQPQANNNKPSGINIVIPEKSNLTQNNGENTPLEKSADILKSQINPPPAPKAVTAPSGGLFGNLSSQPAQQQEKKTDVKSSSSTSLFGGVQKEDNPKSSSDSNLGNGKAPEITVKQPVISSGGLFGQNSTGPSLGLFAKTETPQQVQTQNEIQNEISQPKSLPRRNANAGILENLDQQQQQQKTENTPPSNQGIHSFLQQQQQPAVSSSQEKPSEGLIQKSLPPKNKEINNSDNNMPSGGSLFGNLNKSSADNKLQNAQQIIPPPPAPPAQENQILIAEKKPLFSNLAPSTITTSEQKPAGTGLFGQTITAPSQGGLFNQLPQANNAPVVAEQKPESQSQSIKPPAGGLFGNIQPKNNTTEQKSLFDGQTIKTSSSQGGLFGQQNNDKSTVQQGQQLQQETKQSSSQGLFSNLGNSNQQNTPVIGGLFGKKEEPKEISSFEQKNESSNSFLGTNPQNEVVENKPQGGLFSKDPTKQTSNGIGFLSNKTNEQQQKEVKTIFGNIASVPTSNGGGLFNPQNNNHLKDKPQQLSVGFAPQIQKPNEENGQLFTQVNGTNNQEKQQQQPQQPSQGLFSNIQPTNSNQNISIFSGEPPKAAGSLFSSASQNPTSGLFGGQNQSLLSDNKPQTETKNGMFGNLTNTTVSGSGTGLFNNLSNGNPNGGLFSNIQNNNNSNNQSLFGATGGTGLFSKPAESTTQ